MEHPPGTVGILSGDLSRYAAFQQSVLGMQMPPRTQILYVNGLWIAAALNRIVANMDPGSAWLMLLADDHKFEPDLLLRLLEHQVDLVAPLCALRSPPFRPSVFHEVGEGAYQYYTWHELQGQHGLLPVDTFGGAGAVVRREVLQTLRRPWFTGIGGENPQEDLYSFARMRDNGFQPYVDLDTVIGHITPMVLYPHRQAADGQWYTRIWSHTDLCLLPPYDGAGVLAGESEAK